MFKTIFLFLASTLLSFSLSASAENVLYGDYVNCYYELQRVQSNVSVDTKILVFTPEEIKALYSKFITEPKHKLYTFSPEGFYGAISNGVEKKYCSGCDPVEGYSCAYDFRLLVGNSNYTLCYSKKWEGAETCSESVLDGECDIYDIDSKNLSIGNDKFMINISSEELDSSAFYNILYPLLQKKFANIAHDYIWSPGAYYRFSSDEIVIVDNETPDVVSAAAIKDRYKDITTIINDNKFFPSCRKVGNNIISKTVLNK